MGTAVSINPQPAGASDSPDWKATWQRPWVGAVDYASEDESDSAVGKAGGPLATRAVRDAGEGRHLADLVEDGQKVCVARGGEGGRGNAAFPSKQNRCAPTSLATGCLQLAPSAREGLKCHLCVPPAACVSQTERFGRCANPQRLGMDLSGLLSAG